MLHSTILQVSLYLINEMKWKWVLIRKNLFRLWSSRFRNIQTRNSPLFFFKWKWKSLSRVRLFATLWTVACQALLSMEFSRQGYWSGLPRPPPQNLPDSGIKLVSLVSPALAGGFLTSSATWEAQYVHNWWCWLSTSTNGDNKTGSVTCRTAVWAQWDVGGGNTCQPCHSL